MKIDIVLIILLEYQIQQLIKQIIESTYIFDKVILWIMASVLFRPIITA